MIKAIFRAAAALVAGCWLLSGFAYAQSTAMPVLPGFLSTSGCPSGVSACFIPYSNVNPLPVSGNITANNASVGTNGSTAPTSSTLTGYQNGSGNTVQDSTTNPHPVVDSTLAGLLNSTLNFSSTQTNGTTGTSGTFSQALASSATRHGCLLQNTSSDTLLVFFGATASASTSNALQIAAGAAVSCSAGQIVLTDAIQVTGKASNSDTYILVSQ